MSESSIHVFHKGDKYKLIFSNGFLLLDNFNTVSIVLPSEGNSWVLQFEFINQFTLGRFQQKVEIVTNGANFKLYNWYGDDPVENTEPYFLQSVGGETQFMIKYRTEATLYQPMRSFFISVWRKEKK